MTRNSNATLGGRWCAGFRQAGFTIVEIMVAMLIGLLATVVMFQVFAIFEGQKRTSTGASDAQQNGAASLFAVERDARMAGYGINYFPLLGCTVNGYYEPTGSPFTLVLAPVVIVDGPAGAPDSLTLTYGNADASVQPAKLTQTMPSGSANFRVENRFGFKPGDVLIAAQAGKPCTMRQVSALPTAPGLSDNVVHLSGSYIDPVDGSAKATKFNRPGGMATTYDLWDRASGIGGRLYNVGGLPSIITYGLQADQFVAFDQAAGGAPVALSDGVVQFQAQYGFDGNQDGSVSAVAVSNPVLVLGGPDQWGDAMPAAAGAADWQKVIAVRMAVVARSMQPERPDPVSNVCTATTAFPMWMAANRAIDLSANPNWRCYRYRVFEVTVPLRNMVWYALPS